MSEFRDKLQIFLQHYDKLNSLGEEPDEGFNSEFVVTLLIVCILVCIIKYLCSSLLVLKYLYNCSV